MIRTNNKKGTTGCSLNIVFFSKILKYIPDSGLSRLPLVSVCVDTGRSNMSAAAELAEFRNILRKNTILNEHPVARDDGRESNKIKKNRKNKLK